MYIPCGIFSKSNLTEESSNNNSDLSDTIAEGMTSNTPSSPQSQQQTYKRSQTEPSQPSSPTYDLPFSWCSPENEVFVEGERYWKLGELGRGGSSTVYKVMSEAGEMWALKSVDLRSQEDRAAVSELYLNEISFI